MLVFLVSISTFVSTWSQNGVSIYKRGGVWWMDLYVGSGTRRRRVRKSTGCTEEVQARIIEQSMIAVNRGLTSRLPNG